jgi:hypothetical protein
VEGTLLKTIKSRPGLPISVVWPLTLLLPALILWLPYIILSPINQLIISITTLTAIFTICTIFPRQRIILAYNECQIQTPLKSPRNADVGAMIVTRFGRISGIFCNFYENNHQKPSFGFRLDHIISSHDSLESLKKIIPSLMTAHKTAIFGGLSDWLTAIAAGVAVSGLLRAVLTLA